MNVQKKIQKLKRAYRQIKMVRDSLSDESKDCETCGVKHYVSKVHWQTRQALDSALTRLRRTIAVMKAAPEKYE
jgi:hypothetical protein